MTSDGWWLAGYEARANHNSYDPPAFPDINDPRTLAWIDGYESADHDTFRKAQG